VVDNPLAKAEHGVRTRMDASPNHPSEMDTGEWKLLVGHQIDEVSHQESTLRLQFVVLTPKRKAIDDPTIPPPMTTQSNSCIHLPFPGQALAIL
jgi:hypothetical protein